MKTLYKDYALMSNKEIASYYEDYKEWYIDNDEHITSSMSSEFFNWICDRLEHDWEWIKGDLEYVMKDREYVIQAELGLWNGQRKGTKKAYGLDAVLDCITRDIDYVHIYENYGGLYVDAYHHDGTNHFKIMEKTDKGLRNANISKKWLE